MSANYEYQKALFRADPRKRLLGSARTNAIRFNRPCTITKEDIVIPAVCPILGIPLVIEEGVRRGDSPSIDRIDSTKGYVPGNVCVISEKANRLKGDNTLETLRALVRFMEENDAGGLI